MLTLKEIFLPLDIKIEDHSVPPCLLKYPEFKDYFYSFNRHLIILFSNQRENQQVEESNLIVVYRDYNTIEDLFNLSYISNKIYYKWDKKYTITFVQTPGEWKYSYSGFNFKCIIDGKLYRDNKRKYPYIPFELLKKIKPKDICWLILLKIAELYHHTINLNLSSKVWSIYGIEYAV